MLYALYLLKDNRLSANTRKLYIDDYVIIMAETYQSFSFGRYIFISYRESSNPNEVTRQLGFRMLSRKLGILYIPFVLCTYLIHLFFYRGDLNKLPKFPESLNDLADYLYEQSLK